MPRIIIYNIEYCQNTSRGFLEYLQFWRFFKAPKAIPEELATFLRSHNPDIVALVEIDTGSMRARKQNESKYFAEELGMKHFTHASKYAKEGFFKLFRHLPLFKFQENALLTRYALENVHYHYLPAGSKRLVIEATIRAPKKISLFVVHLALRKKTREKQLYALADIINSCPHPAIVMGDFNTFNDDELNILYENTSLHDSLSIAKKKGLLDKTQPSWKPKYRLDHVLVSPGIIVNNYDIIDFRLSDHLPVMIDFSVQQKTKK